MNVGLSLKLDILERDVAIAVGREAAKELNKILFSMSNDTGIKTQIWGLVDLQIKNTPEYDSLLNGVLAAIFGLSDPGPILDAIIATIKNSIEIDFSPAIFSASTGLSASFTVSLLNDNFSDILALPGTSTTINGQDVTWLKWLLTAGDTDVTPLFRIPPQFTGTITNNWLTRAVDGLDELMGNILFVELKRRV